MTEARRGDPHADCPSESPRLTGKKQPGEGQGTIRRFGNGYDRARTSLKIPPAQALTTAPPIEKAARLGVGPHAERSTKPRPISSAMIPVTSTARSST